MTRYVGYNVFVDHYSDFTNVHIILKLNAESTVKSELLFERVYDWYGVGFLCCHEYTGLLDTKMFKEELKNVKQNFSFCGVNYHHQNGKADNIIKDVNIEARTTLLHAGHIFPRSIHNSLCTASTNNNINLRDYIPKNFKPKTYYRRNKISATYDSLYISIFSTSKLE